jgi:hypothetical protein
MVPAVNLWSCVENSGALTGARDQALQQAKLAAVRHLVTAIPAALTTSQRAPKASIPSPLAIPGPESAMK